MKFLFLFAALIISICLFSSCATVNGTDRKQINLVSNRVLEREAAAYYDQFLSESKICRDAKTLKRVERVSNNLIEATKAYFRATGKYSEIAHFNWQVAVVVSDEPNAWCAAGGKICVYTGILPLLENDDQLATVIGHEIAHATSRHTNERRSQVMLAQIGGEFFNALVSNESAQTQEEAKQAYALTAQYLYVLPFNRSHENEADKIGLNIMAIAGYDPAQAPRVWENFTIAMGDRLSGFSSTHPTNKHREDALRKSIPEAQALADNYHRQKNEPGPSNPKEDALTAKSPSKENGFKAKDGNRGGASNSLVNNKAAKPSITYRIQLEAVSDASKGLAKYQSLNEVGALATEPIKVEGKPYYRILLGDFKDEKQAEKALVKLRGKGYDEANVFLYENGKRVRIVYF